MGRAVGRFKGHGNTFPNIKPEEVWMNPIDGERWNDDFFDGAGLSKFVSKIDDLWEEIRGRFRGDYTNATNLDEMMLYLDELAQELINIKDKLPEYVIEYKNIVDNNEY